MHFDPSFWCKKEWANPSSTKENTTNRHPIFINVDRKAFIDPIGIFPTFKKQKIILSITEYKKAKPEGLAGSRHRFKNNMTFDKECESIF